MVCAHAKMSRIGEFPLNDPENCLYSKNVISFAIEKGYYNPVLLTSLKFTTRQLNSRLNIQPAGSGVYSDG